MHYDISDKTALVTGANRGLGRALVTALLQQGARHIYASYRSDPGDLAELPQVTPLQLDLTDPQNLQQISQQIPQLDLLVHNAGIVSSNPFSLVELSTAQQEMATHYFGPLQLTQSLLPQLSQSPSAALVIINSIAALSNFPSLASYSASKAASHSLTQGLRAELKRCGIAVCGVYPGPIDTRMTQGADIAKAAPLEVAQNILQALAQGIEQVFPDPFSQQIEQQLRQDPSVIEQQFALSLG